MKLQALIILICIFFISTNTQVANAQNTYRGMSRAERRVFVGEQARRIAREISGNDYEFTAAFEEDIKNAVTDYADRIGSREQPDLILTLQRGRSQAQLLMSTFKGRSVSPLIGLYLPWIESEYQNVQPADPKAAVGMFQLLPATGARFGLSVPDLLDVGKSADAAALYISGGLETFKEDPMKEALALLAYNRGAQKTLRDLKFLLKDQQTQCSICALTADRSQRDERFSYENVLYVPRFFAAAIIGENPKAFGVAMKALSDQ